MTRRSVEGIVDALNTYGVRYLIAGGLAVVAHGYLRFTADVDIILDLEPENLPRAVAALESLGYRPRAPVPLHDFADPDKRRQWVVEKGLTVFSLYSPEHPATEINLFVEPPLNFNPAYRVAARLEIAPGVTAVFIAYEDLVRLKLKAGRPQDLEDVERLKAIRTEAPGE